MPDIIQGATKADVSSVPSPIQRVVENMLKQDAALCFVKAIMYY